MKLFQTSKDGGPESKVWAHTVIEIKGLFSIILLRFEDGSRDCYHTHAFNCVNWLISGLLLEQRIDADTTPTTWFNIRHYTPSWFPFIIRRTDFHMVTSLDRSWVLSFRGPWHKTWREYSDGEVRTLTHGRKVL